MALEKSLGIQEFFNRLNKDTIDLVDEFYDRDVHFKDPVVEFKDRGPLKVYYSKLYRDVRQIQFKFSDEVVDGDVHLAVWTMVFKSKLDSGKTITVDGVSHIKFGGGEGKVVYHRDYFDMGEFVYERLPVLSGIIRFVKKKLSQHE